MINMWKRALLCVMTLLGSCTFAYAYFQNQLSASTRNAPTYQIGDTIYYAGSTYTYVGNDGTNLFLLNNASVANNQNWDAAKTSAQNHKNSLGNLGKNMVSSELPTTTTLKQAATSFTGSGTGLNLQLASNIPKISTAWFLGDTDLQASNLVRFLSANNKSEGSQAINTYTNIGSTGSCQSPSAGNTNVGTGYYNAATHGGESVSWDTEVSYTFTYQTSGGGSYTGYDGPNCTGNIVKQVTSNSSNASGTYTAVITQPTYLGVKQFHGYYGFTTGLVLNNGPSPISLTQGWSNSYTYTKGTCYNSSGTVSGINVIGHLAVADGGSVEAGRTINSIKIGTANYVQKATVSKIETTGTDKLVCPAVTNNAYTASSRPLVKVPISQILYGKSTKPVITTSNTINGNEPSNDTGVVNSYLTMETNQMAINLRTGATGVKGSTFEINKTSGSSTVRLPLTITGTQEGTRYVAAKATDAGRNEVYSVLSAVSSTSPDVSIDYSNLVNDDDSSLQIELYVLDSGIGNTMYRSPGTPITIEFQKTAADLSFTDPNTTNIKLGSSDLHETITTNNTEITTSGSNAVKYSLSGGISGTGLTVTNDPSDPKGFTLSIGNTPNSNLPAEFTLTAELETTSHTKTTATKQIHVFQEMSDFKWIPIKTGKLTIAETVNNQLMGHLEVSNGLPKFTYELTSASDSGYDAAKAKDNGRFVISNTPLNSGERAEVKTNTSLSPGIYYIQCKVTDTYGDVLYTDFTIEVSAKEQDFIYTDISGTELPKTGDKYSTYKETYAPNKTFQLYTSGNPTGSTVTYQLKNPTDVISVDKNGLVTILNASGNNDLGQVIVQATSQDPSGMYGDKTIELPITITKANLSVAFNDPNQTTKSITEATVGWNETANATPSTGVKITYSIVGGDMSIIDIDADTGAITYKGSNGYGKVVIEASADDDPTNTHDNYDAGTTTKEIVIYQEVDGYVKPHDNSSDKKIPTFTTSDENVKAGGVIGTIIGTPGTPDDLSTSDNPTYTYTYDLKGDGNATFFEVNASSGEIKTKGNLGTGSYHITVTVSDQWSTKEISVTINVGVAAAEDLQFYEDATLTKVINTKSAKVTDTDVEVLAAVKGSTNTNPITYSIKDGSTNVITIDENSGAITVHGVGTVTIVAKKKGNSGQTDAQAELTFTVTEGEQNFIYTDSTLKNELAKTGNSYDAYKETYAPNKTFQLYTAGYPNGSIVTYQLKNPTDVISVDKNGLVTILNASEGGNVIVQATSSDPSGNYSDKTIELPIFIEKGTRTVSFAENPINVTNGTGSVTPVIHVDGVIDTDKDAFIELDTNEDSTISWTNDNKTIEYDYDGTEGKDIKWHVTKPGNRNYETAVGEGILHIMGAEESVLAVTVPGKITYGDHFTIRSTQNDDASDNVQYSFTVSDTIFISNPTVNGNKAEFDAIRCSEGKEIEITITRTADGEVPLTKKVKVKVLPKPISIVIEDKEKKRLEENPTLTYQDFSDQLVTWNGVKDEIDTGVIKLSTTATKLSKEGSYPITTNITQQYNDNYPNYHFTIQEGTLKVLDNGNKDFWDSDNDDCPDLNIVLGKDEDGFDIRLNEDINDDGIPELNIDSDGDGKADINIDQDDDGIPDVNIVNVKKWNPSICVKGQAEEYCTDPSLIPNLNIDLDGDGRPDINVDLDNDGIPDIDIDTDGDGNPDINIDKDKDGKPDENIKKLTEWKIDDTIFEANGKKYQTMTGIEIEDQKYLEDNGIRIEKPNGEAFSPNLELKVTDVTEDQKDEVANKASALIADDQEVKQVYDVKLLENGTEVQSDGTLKIKIPVDRHIQNPILLKKNSDGTYEKISTVIENGYLVYESDELGIVTIVGDKETIEEPNDKINSSVQGTYYPGDNVGGINTGDTTNLMLYLGTGCISLGILFLILFKRKQEDSE